jgi:uncharacterized membrane protein
MNSLASTITSKALAGLIILVPLGILGLVVLEIYGLLEDTAAFAALTLPFPPIVNGLIFIAIGLLAVFSACVITGVLMSTGPGKKFGQFMQKTLAEKIPLFGLIRNVVFIPSAPAVTLGQIYIIPAERVKLLDCSMTSVVNTITQWGVGASEIYKTRES